MRRLSLLFWIVLLGAALGCTFYLLFAADRPVLVPPINTTSTAQALRSQIALYTLQHNVPPDFKTYPHGEQLLAKTSIDGLINPKGSLGPYLDKGFPHIDNPANRLPDVQFVDHPIAHGMSVSDKPVGWVYSIRSNLLYPTDPAGLCCVNPTMLPLGEPTPQMQWSAFENSYPTAAQIARATLGSAGLLPEQPSALWLYPGGLAALLVVPVIITARRSPRQRASAAADAGSIEPPPIARYDTRHVRRRVHLND